MKSVLTIALLLCATAPAFGAETQDCHGTLAGVGEVSVTTYPFHTCWSEDPDRGPAGCGNIARYKISTPAGEFVAGLTTGPTGVNGGIAEVTLQTSGVDVENAVRSSGGSLSLLSALQKNCSDTYCSYALDLFGSPGGEEFHAGASTFRCDPNFVERASSGEI